MTKYNGWTNRETWLVNLWFGDNLYQEFKYGVEISADYIRGMIEKYVYGQIESSGFIADMLDLDAVNYQELEQYFQK